MMELLRLLYALGGADAVREMLKGAGLPEEAVEQIIRSLSSTQD
jgi:hypothetical protein